MQYNEDLYDKINFLLWEHYRRFIHLVESFYIALPRKKEERESERAHFIYQPRIILQIVLLEGNNNALEGYTTCYPTAHS